MCVYAYITTAIPYNKVLSILYPRFACIFSIVLIALSSPGARRVLFMFCLPKGCVVPKESPMSLVYRKVFLTKFLWCVCSQLTF